MPPKNLYLSKMMTLPTLCTTDYPDSRHVGATLGQRRFARWANVSLLCVCGFCVGPTLAQRWIIICQRWPNTLGSTLYCPIC